MSISSIKTRKRIGFIFLISTIMLLTLSARLIWVQFVMGEDLREKAFMARFRNVEVKAKRGAIYDAKGRPLAISVSTDSFYAIPAQVKKEGGAEEKAAKIAQVLEMDQAKVEVYSAALRGIFLSSMFKREIGEAVFPDALRAMIHGIVLQMFLDDKPSKGDCHD